MHNLFNGNYFTNALKCTRRTVTNALATHTTHTVVDYPSEVVVFANGSLPAYMQAGATVYTQILIKNDLDLSLIHI